MTTANAPFSPAPSLARPIAVHMSNEPAPGSTLGLAVGRGRAVPASLGVDRDRLDAAGFDGSIGATLVIATQTGPTLVATGIGDPASLDAAGLRDAAAAFARAAGANVELAFSLDGLGSVELALAAQVVVEGVLLARYRYDPLRREPKGKDVSDLTLVVAAEHEAAVRSGADRGLALVAATSLARDLANSPHSHLNATGLADLAVTIAAERGLEIEVFDKDDLIALGCGGLLGVNAGSVEPPRMIKLTHRPDGASGARLTFVGKGLMYDSGGLALKAGDEVHAQMKNDMGGAAAVLAAMSVLGRLGCQNTITAYLMCTDNMPSGSAMAMGDVITMRGGTTVEVINTDAEGRLVMADALVLATEEPVDAIVDIATLTGACMRALGTQVAGVIGNHQGVVDQIVGAADATGEPVWQLPLERRYRKELDSPTADLRNMGGANGGAITAALFLAEFVGDVPWAHIDIAGTAQTFADTLWHTIGCSGFGARLLAQLAVDFSIPS